MPESQASMIDGPDFLSRFRARDPEAIQALAGLYLRQRRHALGASLVELTMGGALFTHATKFGWSGNAAAEMWPMALVVLAAASFVGLSRLTRS